MSDDFAEFQRITINPYKMYSQTSNRRKNNKIAKSASDVKKKSTCKALNLQS